MLDRQYRTFFLQSTVGMGCVDLSGRVLSVNPAFCRLLGYSATELQDIRLHYLIHPSDVKNFHQAFEQLLTQASHFVSLDHRFLRCSGESIWVLSRLSILRDEITSLPLAVAATFEDIDQRKNLEFYLRSCLDRDSILATFTQQMLQSLDLEDLLQSCVESIRQYLQADRVLVYRFEPDFLESSSPDIQGEVIIESVGRDWQSMLGVRIADPCLKNCLEPYHEGRVRAISDIRQAGLQKCYIDLLIGFQVTANLIIPINQEDTLWGLLVIQQCERPRVWRHNEIHLLQQVSSQMAIALKQSELHLQVQQEAHRQRALNELSQAILSVQDLESFFDLALDKISQAFQAEHILIGQYQPKGDRWLLIAEKKLISSHPNLLGYETHISPPMIWPHLVSSSSILLNLGGLTDLEQSHPFSFLPKGNWIFSSLIIQSGLWGSLMVYSSTLAKKSWEADQQELMQLMSQHLSLAIQQNLFYQRLQRKTEQQLDLHRLANTIRHSLDLPEVCQIFAREAKDLLQVERVLILEFDPNQRTWKVCVDEVTGSDLKRFVDLEIPDDLNTLTHALRQGNSLRFNPDNHFSEQVLKILAKTFPGAWLMLPLKVSQMTWGMLHCIQKDDWQDWQEAIAISVAEKLEIAIQHSLLFKQVLTANQKLEEIAIIDGLTQVPNRRYFDDYFQQEWQRSRREQSSIALLLCDVDCFKLYNDTYGHQAGDEALKAIAHTLKCTIQRPGDVVARYGGEEFALVLPGSTSMGATRIAIAIHQAIADLAIPHSSSPIDDHITLSIGIASTYPHPTLSPSILLSHADQALYQAKNNGKNQFYIYQGETQT